MPESKQSILWICLYFPQSAVPVRQYIKYEGNDQRLNFAYSERKRIFLHLQLHFYTMAIHFLPLIQTVEWRKIERKCENGKTKKLLLYLPAFLTSLMWFPYAFILYMLCYSICCNVISFHGTFSFMIYE